MGGGESAVVAGAEVDGMIDRAGLGDHVGVQICRVTDEVDLALLVGTDHADRPEAVRRVVDVRGPHHQCR